MTRLDLLVDAATSLHTAPLRNSLFDAQMVELLSAKGADAALMTRLVELFRGKRQAGDKGVAVAYRRLLAVMRQRQDETAAKAASAALREYLAATQQQPEAAAVPAAAATAAAPVPAAVSA
jgi:hypothetical protein